MGRTTSTAVAACLAALVVAVPSAGAAVTKSTVTTPKDMTYVLYQNDTPNSITVAGTTNGNASDHVDLLCTFGNGSWPMAYNVAVNSNGSFLTSSVSLSGAPYVPCRIRAVPSGTTPSNLAPYAGPRLLDGWNETTKVDSGPNAGKLVDYYSYFQQLKGGFDFDSLSSCSVCDGYLTDSSYNKGPTTFYGNAALYPTSGTSSPRSEVQVDGVNAYMPQSAWLINKSAAGLPTLGYTYHQDQKTGNAVITETDPLVTCPDSTYPPNTSSCSSFQSAGVTAYVTMTQNHAGRICWFSVVFKSTDGTSHALDLLWDNAQVFHRDGAGNSALVETRFPGESGYSTHVVGDTVQLPAKPGTVFFRMQGAADGDPTTGRGAIVYDRAATSAQFRTIKDKQENFILHQTGTVPKNGSVRFRFAYVEAYLQADVASMATLATSVYRGCKVPNVVGKTLAAAKKAITHAGCTVGKVSRVHSSKVAAGRVVSESPKAKRQVEYGTKVALVVAK
jgi:hypothetical protein